MVVLEGGRFLMSEVPLHPHWQIDPEAGPSLRVSIVPRRAFLGIQPLYRDISATRNQNLRNHTGFAPPVFLISENGDQPDSRVFLIN